jgi:hypothetical protein
MELVYSICRITKTLVEGNDMKETCKGLLMLFIIIVIMAMMTGPVFAGPYKRTLTIFPHVHKQQLFRKTELISRNETDAFLLLL